MMKKRFLTAAACLLMLAGGSAGAAAADDAAGQAMADMPMGMAMEASAPVASDMKLTLDGHNLALDAAYLIDNSLFVPYRAFAEGIGGEVGWDEATKTVTVQKGGNTIKLTIGSREANVNGVAVTMVGPAQLIDGSTFVHSRFLAEAFGIMVHYDDATRTVDLMNSDKPGVQVFGVSEGGTYTGDSVQIGTAVYNLQLTDFREHNTAVSGEGHVHLWLDQDVNDPTVAYKQIDTQPVTFGKLAPGEHTLTVMLEDNTHQPLQPEVKRVVHFTTVAVEAAHTYNVDISNFKFNAPEMTVEAGSTIVFTNHDQVKHNAVADNGSFETPLLAQGESASITLGEPGEYTYFCAPHKSFMKGKIIVK